MNFIIDFFIVLNKESLNFFLKQIRVSSTKIKIISNALNEKFMKKSNFKNSTKKLKKFGMASRINILKRHDLIIDAFQSKLLKEEKIKCYFAGSGENIIPLKKMIKNKKMFKFCGALNSNELKKWYDSLDFYIQATTGEGHSTSMLQAMGMNLPVLGSNVSGVKNFLHPKKNIGLVFDNRQTSLSIKIKSILKMSNYKKKNIVASQKKYLLNNFTEQKFLENYKIVIKKLVFDKNPT